MHDATQINLDARVRGHDESAVDGEALASK